VPLLSQAALQALCMMRCLVVGLCRSYMALHSHASTVVFLQAWPPDPCSGSRAVPA
jgi:hypothetical protein